MAKNSMHFVGLDLGDRHSYLVLLDSAGELVEETRLPSTRAALQRRFTALPPSRVAMEVGAQSRWASDLLRQLGHEVLVANARKLRAIYDNPHKSDRADAETLARLVRMDPKLLSPIHHRSPPWTARAGRPKPTWRSSVPGMRWCAPARCSSTTFAEGSRALALASRPVPQRVSPRRW